MTAGEWQPAMGPEAPIAIRHRLARFVLAGVLAAVIQLAVLTLLLHNDWDSLAADALAFLLAAQVNFVLASFLTWRDRWLATSLPYRWVKFHLAIASTAGLNLLTFALAQLFIPDDAAAMLGIAAAGAVNFLLGDRIVFRHETATGCAPLARMRGRVAALLQGAAR
jgi:putative flippase GtrA